MSIIFYHVYVKAFMDYLPSSNWQTFRFLSKIKVRVRLICKMKVLDRTVQDSTRQNSTGQTFTILNKFCLVWYLMEKMLFWWFRKVVLRTKSCPMVQWGTRISDFVQSLDPQFVQYQWQFSNQTQYNRSCPVQSPIF